MLKRLAVWIQWHRRAGLIVAPVLVMVAVTGILINHSQDLGWYSEPVYSPVLGWLYGIPPDRITQGYALDTDADEEHWLVQSGQHIYLDTQSISECEQTLHGAIYWPLGYVLFCGDALTLLTADGQLIERMTDLPAGAVVLGINNSGQIALKTAAAILLLDNDRWEWQRAESDAGDDAVLWSLARPLPPTLKAQLNQLAPLPGLSLERVLLDLHSGRLFGQWGVWLVDASAILMLFLALSGTLTWVIRERRKRRR